MARAERYREQQGNKAAAPTHDLIVAVGCNGR
jgi:hypothetical protein